MAEEKKKPDSEIRNITLAERLKAERERNGISLSTVADQTKIRHQHLCYLEGLSQPGFKPLPNAYYRGYLRIYCMYLSIDVGACQDDIDQLFPSEVRCFSGEQFKIDDKVQQLLSQRSLLIYALFPIVCLIIAILAYHSYEGFDNFKLTPSQARSGQQSLSIDINSSDL
ncbi:MAG: helix-turn-helix domain-containing protein [Pseudomonadota bacterium]|nr:helix-turn-helix domain-containing protein [Pseudomonadota bacterium]